MERKVNDQLKLESFGIDVPSNINIRDVGHALLISKNDCEHKNFKTTKSYRDLAEELLIAYRQHQDINHQVWGSNPAYVCS